MSRHAAFVALALLALTALLLALEFAGVPVRWPWQLGGDLRRESRQFEQYGQVASFLLIAALIWCLDPPRRRLLPAMAVTLLVTSGVVNLAKNGIGRARPDAGGPADFRGPNADKSGDFSAFPSGHTAGAVATSALLAMLYPRAAPVFWGLAVICGVLRYLSKAHWPSDVLAGAAAGYAVAHLVWSVLAGEHPPPPGGGDARGGVRGEVAEPAGSP